MTLDVKKAVADIATSAYAIEAASDVLPALAHEAQTGRGSKDNAGETFQLDAEPQSPGAGPEPNSFLLILRPFGDRC